MARIRTIPKAAEELRRNDPETFITPDILRRWVKRGIIPTVPLGGRHSYVDLDAIEAILSASEYQAAPDADREKHTKTAYIPPVHINGQSGYNF